MQPLIQYLAEGLTQEPDKVSVSQTENEHGPLLLLKVAEGDANIIIGRQGRTIKALRSLLAAASGKKGQRFFLELDPSLALVKNDHPATEN